MASAHPVLDKWTLADQIVAMQKVTILLDWGSLACR
jgi:hypothetical protein